MSAYPNEAGFTKQGASLEAAELINPILNDLQGRVFGEILNHVFGATPEEVAEELQLDLYLVRPRFSELGKLGLIEEVGRKKFPEKRVPITVWQAISKKDEHIILGNTD